MTRNMHSNQNLRKRITSPDSEPQIPTPAFGPPKKEFLRFFSNKNKVNIEENKTDIPTTQKVEI